MVRIADASAANLLAAISQTIEPGTTIQTDGWKGYGGELDAVIARWRDSQLEMTPEANWQYDALLEKVETSMLVHLLERFENRPTRLASALRLNRATLRQKLRRAGLSGDS